MQSYVFATLTLHRFICRHHRGSCPTLKCVHWFLKENVWLSFQNLNWLRKKFKEKNEFLKSWLHWKWHCWVLERPYQVLIQYNLRIMPKLKLENRQIFAISCLCQCKIINFANSFQQGGNFLMSFYFCNVKNYFGTWFKNTAQALYEV